MALPSRFSNLRAAVATVLLAFVSAVAVYELSCLWLPPSGTPFSFGLEWQRMSEDPFALRGQFPHRILSPLLAFCLGLGGGRFELFVRAEAVLLLAVAFLCCRRRAGLLDALLVTLGVGASGAVQMYKQCWVGYVDDLSYSLLLLAVLAARRPVLFWSLWFLSLMNHEVALFLLPWLWHRRRLEGGGGRSDAVLAAGALAAYAAFYVAVGALAEERVYDAAFFARNHLFPYATAWLWVLCLVQWLAAYGPLLVMLPTAWHGGAPRERQGMLLAICGTLAVFSLAFDVTRHANLLVLPLVTSATALLARGRRILVAALVAGAVLQSIWLSPWTASSWPMGYFLKAMANSGVYADYRRIPTHLIPAVWPSLLLVAAAAAAVHGAGFWIARSGRPASGR
ncbi:MAG: hypothetical protein Fur0037_06970 [Planctomycetota bacterium]